MRCVVGEVMPRVAAHTGWQGECVKDDEALLFPLHVLAGMLLCADHTCPVATLLSPHLLCSAENTSPVSRHSWALHVIDSAPGFTWSPDNWAQRPADNPWQPLYDDTASSSQGGHGSASIQFRS